MRFRTTLSSGKPHTLPKHHDTLCTEVVKDVQPQGLKRILLETSVVCVCFTEFSTSLYCKAAQLLLIGENSLCVFLKDTY